MQMKGEEMPLPRKVQNIWDENRIREACRLYAVTDSSNLHGRSLHACVADAIVGGATFVQLRFKGASTLDRIRLIRSIAPVCRVANIPFVIDDDIEAAKATGIDGVHIGQEDISCAEARRVLGNTAIIGVSAQTVDQALAAQDAGANYLGVGAIFGTSTKPDAKLVSIETLKEICNAVSIPVVAIGGLNVETVPMLAGTGIAGVAVVSAIFGQEDIEGATEALAAEVNKIIN